VRACVPEAPSPSFSFFSVFRSARPRHLLQVHITLFAHITRSRYLFAIRDNHTNQQRPIKIMSLEIQVREITTAASGQLNGFVCPAQFTRQMLQLSNNTDETVEGTCNLSR
jgi:hypothetical protein